MSDTPITPNDRRRIADAINTLRRAELAHARDDVRALSSVMAGVDPLALAELVEVVAAPPGIEVAVSVTLPERLPFATSVYVEAGDSVEVGVDGLGMLTVTATKRQASA